MTKADCRKNLKLSSAIEAYMGQGKNTKLTGAVLPLAALLTVGVLVVLLTIAVCGCQSRMPTL